MSSTLVCRCSSRAQNRTAGAVTLKTVFWKIQLRCQATGLVIVGIGNLWPCDPPGHVWLRRRRKLESPPPFFLFAPAGCEPIRYLQNDKSLNCFLKASRRPSTSANSPICLRRADVSLLTALRHHVANGIDRHPQRNLLTFLRVPLRRRHGTALSERE